MGITEQIVRSIIAFGAIVGLWVHAVILTILIVLSGGILLPFVMLYGGLKANETLEDARLARHSVY